MATTFNYGDAVSRSLLFYEAQRSGPLPASNRVTWRRSSAPGDAKVIYDANNNGVIDSGETITRDLSGGYYDAGDYMKYAYPMAGAMTMLSWGVNQYQAAYQSTGQLDEALDTLRWGVDWLLKAHETTGSGSTLQTVRLWAQVGRTATDHNTWVDDQRIALPRPGYFIDATRPGTDYAAEAAAALASASISFRASDPAYAGRLLDNAKALLKFAYQFRGLTSTSVPDSASVYGSNTANDDLAWGAIWLHKAVKAAGGNTAETFSWANQQTYLQIAKANNIALGNWTQSWADKQYGAAILIAQEDPSVNRSAIENWLNFWAGGGSSRIRLTSGGLAFLDGWGSLRYAANTAFLAGIYSDTLNDYSGRYANFSKSQIDYILGNNPRGSSYMVGFGASSPRNPHHASSHLNGNPLYTGSNGWTLYGDGRSNQNLLVGALVGGPGSANDLDYVDVRTDYQRNEVALDYNAAFTGALARLAGGVSPPPLPSLSISPAQTVVEGFNASVAYTLTLSAAASQPVRVDYATASDSATAGLDFSSLAGTLTFQPGELSKTITINLLNDTLSESDERFVLNLSNPVQATLTTTTVATTISDTLVRDVTTILPAAVENLTLMGTGAINGTGNAGNNRLVGNSGANVLAGLAGADTLVGGAGADVFAFHFSLSTVSACDRITDYAIGVDKIDLLTSSGTALAAPAAFTRAGNSSASTLSSVVNAVFQDSNGQISGNQPLGLNAAALVLATAPAIAGLYLVVNNGSAGFQSAQDVVVNLTGYTGTLPALGSIPVSAFFV